MVRSRCLSPAPCMRMGGLVLTIFGRSVVKLERGRLYSQQSSENEIVDIGPNFQWVFSLAFVLSLKLSKKVSKWHFFVLKMGICCQ